MQKESSSIGLLFGNLNRLLPFVGFLMVVAGILGLIFVQKPLGETQELRSDASENTQVVWPKLSATNPGVAYHVDDAGQISLDLTLENIVISKVNVIFNIIAENIETPVITVIEASGLEADQLEVEETTDGYLVRLRAVPILPSSDFALKDKTIIRVSFTPKVKGNISINFDEDNSYVLSPILAYALDAPNINFVIKDRLENYQENESDSASSKIFVCNESCLSNSECEVNHRCFNTEFGKKCRLSVNPSSTNCSKQGEVGPNKQCNQSCNNSKDCAQGLSCWNNVCKNPANAENASCFALTDQEKSISVANCNESCSSNANCAINFRCYQNKCRLATNPSSLSCSTVIEKTVSPIYDKTDNDGEKGETPDDDESLITPVTKGDNIIPEEEIKFEEKGDQPTSMVKTDEVSSINQPVDETALDALVDMLKDKQKSLPTTVVLIGVGLLAASLLVLFIAKLSSGKPKNLEKPPVPDLKPTSNLSADPTSTPTLSSVYSQEEFKNDRIKELMKKLDEQSKNQNQG